MATDHNFRIKNGLEVGGSLIVNSSGQLVAVTASSHIHYLDNVQAKFGNSGDLKIYHNGSNSYIQEAGTGELLIQSNTVAIQNAAGTENMAKFIQDGAVQLYHNDSKKLETTTYGAMSTGDFSAGSTSGAHVYLSSSGGIEIVRTAGSADPYIDFKDNASDDYDVRLQMDDNKFYIKTGGAGNIATTAVFDDNKLYLSGTTANYQSSDGNYLRNTTAHGYIQIGPGNTSHAHFLTDRSNFYFNKQIQVDTGIITSHNEDLVLRRAQTSTTGQLTLSRGKFTGGSQSATDLLNSSIMIGGFHANSAFEEASGHFYIPGLSPNQLAGSHRRHTVTVTKNGTTQSGDFSNMFSANGANTSFSHAAGSTDTIVITITGIAMAYGQHVGVQFGHLTFRAKDIEIELTTDNGANWTSVYDVTNFPYASVAHYHGGSGTATNGIRYTFTNFNNTGMRINQLFCYDYSENEIYFAERNQDQIIRGNWTFTDNYKAKFGSSGDLEIYHAVNESWIKDTGTGNLYIDTNGSAIQLTSNNSAKNMIVAVADGGVTLYHNGSDKFSTQSWGALVNGTLNTDKLHIGAGSTDLIDVHHDGTFTSTYRNNTGGVLDRRYADYGNDGTTVEFQTRVGMDGNYSSIGNFSAHGLQIRTNNTNRLNIASGGNVEVQGTAHLIAPTIRVTNDATDTVRHRVAVYDSGSTSYGMMLWNSNGTSGDWATMIYGPNQSNRRISFGKVGTSGFTNHSHVNEIAYFDLDNQNLYLTNGTLFATGSSDGVVARKGAFGPSQTSLHGSYDLYNNGTTYLNGAVTVDDNLDIANKIRHIGDTDTYLSFANADDFRIVVGNSTRAAFNTSKIHFNQEGINQDFQVESNNSTHMLFIDASTDRVGMGTNSPEYPLHVQGVVDGDFGIGIFNQKSYGVGTGVNETATLTLGIKESGIAATSRVFGQIRVATTNETSSSSGKMTFNVRSSGSVVERAILDHSGNFTVDGTLAGSTVNTGQGATEVHLMNQNVRTTDSPTFATLTLTGDLNITGDINTVTVNDLDVQDKTITVAAGAASSSAADNAGLIIGGAGSKILWDHAEDKFQFSHGINFDRDTYSETNQNLGIYWSAWDKESGGDQSDTAFIRHTENTGGHSNSVLEIKSGNDSGDGIAFTTHSGSTLKHNSSNILTAANFTSNITNLLTTSTTFAGDVDGTYNSLVIDVPTQTSAPTASTGRLWWDSNTGNLKIYNGSVWVTAAAIPDVSGKYDKTGGAITGAVSMSSTLAVTGNITGSANIQGNAIIKTGGTSSQFLKADGSVDSSTYLTGNQTITLTGDVTGSGTTSITTTVANDSHNHSSSSGNFSVGGTLFVPQKIEHTGDSNTYMEFNSGDEWRVVTGGVERIRIQGGDIGIGNVGPTDGDLTLNSPKLHVKGPGTAGAYNLVARFEGGNDSDNTGGAILINHGNDRGLMIEGGRSASDRGVAYLGLLNSAASHTRIFGLYQDGGTYTAGINIDPGTYPHTDLQVGNPEIASTGITIAARYDVAAAKLTFRTGHPNNANVWNTSQIASTDDGNYNGRLEFRTSVSGQAAPTTRMFIRANGNVGIGNGVFTPNSLLDVNGTLTANNLILQNLPAGTPTTALMIDSSGNVEKRTLGSNAFNSTAYLPLTGGTMSGAVTMAGQTWNGDVTWNTGKNILVAGESSIDVSGSGYFQVYDSGSGAAFIKCDVGVRTEIGIAGSRGLKVHGEMESSSLDVNGNGDISGALNVGGNLTIADQIRIGDDAWLEDYNVANSVRVKGNQNNNIGFIAFGQQTASLGCNGTSTLSYNGLNLVNINGDLYSAGKKFMSLRSNSSNTERGPWNPIITSIRNSGRRLYPDEDFRDGSNSISVYNNSGGGTVTHTREDATTNSGGNAPNSSGKVIRINHNGGTSSPGFGGFIHVIPSEDNHTFVQIFQAKLPTGKELVIAENAQGTNNQSYWLTDTAGTGKWEWYGRVSHCGNSGSFSSGGHVYVSGGSGNFNWYLASSTVIDVTEPNLGETSFFGNIILEGDPTTSNQDRMIDFTGYDKEGTTDFSDRAFIKHTENIGGHSGSVLVLSSQNDANDGIAFLTNGSSYLKHNSNNIFTEAYHPNADKWTTARTLTLTGDVTGSVSWDGSGNVSMTTAVVNDSHTHDTRYLIKTGDTATGIHEVDGRWHFNPSTNSSYREGIRLNRSTTGWGGAVFGGVRDSIDGITEAWWVARNPSKNLVLSYGTSADSGGLLLTHNNTTMKYKNQRVFMDDYHPNADKWTTARSHTVTLTGEVTGTATQSVDGTGNKTWSIATTLNHSSLDDQYLIKDGANIQAYLAGTGEMFKWQNNTSGGHIQLGFQQNDTDGLHHRLYLKTYKGSAAASGNVDIIVRGSGGSTTSDVLELHSGQRASWQGNDIFTDGYHPNADKWTTARTLTLTGDATGSGSWDGSGNLTITTTVGNDSHFHHRLDSTDDRDVKPSDTGIVTSVQAIKPFFTSFGGMTGTANTTYLDMLAFDTYSDSSGGGPSAITFHKGAGAGDPKMYIWKAGWNATTWSTGQRVFADNYHPNADTWTTARTATVTLTGDATGTAGVSVNGSGNWTNSIAVTVGSIDGQQFYNTRQNQAYNSTGLGGNGIFYYTSGPGNFSGNASDGAAYYQSYSSNWQHLIHGDYRSGALAVKSRNNGTWQETKRIPMIFTGSTTPTITTHADNSEFWYDTSDGKLKFYYNDGTSAQWVDAVAVPSVSNLYSKGGGAITGAVTINSTLTVDGNANFDGDYVYGHSNNGTGTLLQRFGGLYFTWDADQYGTNFDHSITSTSNGSWGDHITLNSFGDVRINIDSNNNGTNTFSIGHANTGTNHTLFTLAESGKITLWNSDLRQSTNNADPVWIGHNEYTNSSSSAIELCRQTFTGVPGEIKFYTAPSATTAQAMNFRMNYQTFHAEADIVAYSNQTSSDIKLKKNVRDLEGSLNKTLKLRGVKFDWKDEEKGKDELGFIAQEIEEVVPEVVKEVDSIGKNEGKKHKVVNYPALVPMLVEAIKEQQTIINKLEQRLSDLEKREE